MPYYPLRLVIAITLMAIMPTMAHATSDNDVIAFAKTAYASMLAIDQKDPAFAKKSLENFKALFDFDAFGGRCLTDVTAKITPEESGNVKQLFSDVFFTNFERKTDSLLKRRIANPAYARKATSPEYDIVTISGASSQGQVTFAFYVHRDTAGAWRIMDIEVDSVLLSRNWRGSFNKVFREQGYAGLTERLTARLVELRSPVK